MYWSEIQYDKHDVLHTVVIYRDNRLPSVRLMIFTQRATQPGTSTVYPKKYAHGFCFAVLCCGYTLTDFPISIRLTSLALWQSNDCPSASKATLMNMDKYFMWIHYERLHNHKKAKHNKTMCIFLGIYCNLCFSLFISSPMPDDISTAQYSYQAVLCYEYMCVPEAGRRGAGTGNYIPQYLRDVITCPSPGCLFLAHMVMICICKLYRVLGVAIINCNIMTLTSEGRPSELMAKLVS